MAITKERKHELVAEYTDLLSKTDGFIVTEYRGLTVAQVNSLRNKMAQASGGSYVVTKNTLFGIALRDNGWPVPDELLAGPVAIVFGNGNLPAVAKDVIDYQKEQPELFVVKGGVVGSSIFQATDLEAITQLPTLPEIQAQLLGLIVQLPSALVGILNQPPTELVSVVNAATSSVVNVLQAYINEKSE